MKIDYSFKILEALLTAKEYKSREDVISTAELVARVVCFFGNLAPVWTAGYKEAVNKLKTLSFEEMQEIIGILNSYDEDENPNIGKQPEDRNNIPEQNEKWSSDFGDEVYQKGMDCYAQKEYSRAVEYFRKAAYQGNAKAEYNYALCLYNGIGVNVDKIGAIKCLAAASESGIAQADKLLGFIAYGNGT